MELNEDIFNNIHQYLNGTLETVERKKFETLINQNSALAQEVAMQRRIKSGLKVNDYKQQFSNIHTQLKEENTLPVFEGSLVIKQNLLKSNLRYFAYAASIILMIGVGLFFYLKPNPIEQVANSKRNKTMQSIKISKPNAIELTDVKKPIRKSASIDFNKIFSDNFINNPVIESPFSSEKFGISPSKIASWESDTLNLRKGIHYLKLGKSQNAIVEFQKLSDSKFENIRFHAQWYLALSYIQKKDIIKAEIQLTTIAESDKHHYSKRVKALMKLLKLYN